MPRIMALIAGFFDSCETGKELVLTIEEARKKRSLDANAYYWALAHEIAAKSGAEVTTVYRQHIQEIGGNCEILCMIAEAADNFCRIWERRGLGWVAEQMPSKLSGCVNVRAYYGSSTYDTKQMSRLIDLAIQDCREFGIDYRTPQEIASMLALWEDKDAR